MYYPYNEFINDLKVLVKKIDEEFDTIIPISRGGLTIGHILGEYYNIREVFTINSIGYEDTKKLPKTKVINIPDIKDSNRVLIVDDIIDSGDTMKEVLKLLKLRYPNTIFFIATIFYKKDAKIRPNWYVKEAKDWIDFFWIVDLEK